MFLSGVCSIDPFFRGQVLPGWKILGFYTYPLLARDCFIKGREFRSIYKKGLSLFDTSGSLLVAGGELEKGCY